MVVCETTSGKQDPNTTLEQQQHVRRNRLGSSTKGGERCLNEKAHLLRELHFLIAFVNAFIERWTFIVCYIRRFDIDGVHRS